jgi:hypothetical protein
VLLLMVYLVFATSLYLLPPTKRPHCSIPQAPGRQRDKSQPPRWVGPLLFWVDTRKTARNQLTSNLR